MQEKVFIMQISDGLPRHGCQIAHTIVDNRGFGSALKLVDYVGLHMMTDRKDAVTPIHESLAPTQICIFLG